MLPQTGVTLIEIWYINFNGPVISQHLMHTLHTLNRDCGVCGARYLFFLRVGVGFGVVKSPGAGVRVEVAIFPDAEVGIASENT